MFRFTRYLATILFAFTAVKPAMAYIEQPEPYRKIIALCNTTENLVDCRKQIEDSARKDSGDQYFRREANALFIRHSKGSLKLEDNDSEGDQYVKNGYLMFDKSLNSHVVNRFYGEAQNFMVVNNASGNYIFVPGFPLKSPDSLRFVSVSHGGEASYGITEIQITRPTLNGFVIEKRLKYDPYYWGPRLATWVNSKAILISGICRLDSLAKCHSRKLIYKNKRWHVAIVKP